MTTSLVPGPIEHATVPIGAQTEAVAVRAGSGTGLGQLLGQQPGRVATGTGGHRVVSFRSSGRSSSGSRAGRHLRGYASPSPSLVVHHSAGLNSSPPHPSTALGRQHGYGGARIRLREHMTSHCALASSRGLRRCQQIASLLRRATDCAHGHSTLQIVHHGGPVPPCSTEMSCGRWNDSAHLSSALINPRSSASGDCDRKVGRSGPSGAGAVRARPGAGELASVDDEVLVAQRVAGEVGLEDLPGAGGVAGLSGQ